MLTNNLVFGNERLALIKGNPLPPFETNTAGLAISYVVLSERSLKLPVE